MVDVSSKEVITCSDRPSDLTFLVVASAGVTAAGFTVEAPLLDADHLPSTAIAFFPSRLDIALGPVGGAASETEPFSALGMAEGRIPRGFCKGSTGAAWDRALGPVGMGFVGSITLLDDATAFGGGGVLLIREGCGGADG